MMEQARRNRAADIFKLGGKVYAFDSTTIPLCLSVFWWAKFRKKKGGVKVHVLYDLEQDKYQPSITSPLPQSMIPRPCQKFLMRQVLTTSSTVVTTTSRELFRIQRMESFFVVRAKTNLQNKCQVEAADAQEHTL